MTGRLRHPNACDNMNHRRANAPVGHCPKCGGVVNDSVRTQSCSEVEHAAARRRQAVFCVHCGMQLIMSR
jgi:ribosomal protein L37AE/L43A